MRMLREKTKESPDDDHHGDPFENGNKERETNPFLMKPTKSMRRAARDQKKRDNKEQILQKKKRKAKMKEEKTFNRDSALKQQIVGKAVDVGPNKCQNKKDTAFVQGASTLLPIRATENVQQCKGKPTCQTIDSRIPVDTTLVRAPIPVQDKRDNNQYTPPQAKIEFSTAHDPVDQPRPRSLDVNLSASSTGGALECRTTSPHVPRSVEDGERCRESSVCKGGKDKKKKRKIGPILRRIKMKNRKRVDLLDDKAVASQDVMKQQSEEKLMMLQKIVDETEEVMRQNAKQLMENNISQLNHLLKKSENLEDIAFEFAKTADEIKLQQRAGARCCGIFSNWKICWYICACERGVKRRKNKNKTGRESHEMFSPRAAADLGDDDQPYGASPGPQTLHDDQTAFQSSNLTEKAAEGCSRPASETSSLEEGRKNATENSSSRSKPGKGSQTLPRSSPSLSCESSSGSLRNAATLDCHGRDSSSGNFSQEIVQKRDEKKKKKEKRKREEKGIERYVEENYMDEETKKRAASLLRIDVTHG